MNLEIHPNARRTPGVVLLELSQTKDITGLVTGYVNTDGDYVLSLSDEIEAGDVHLLGALLQDVAIKMAKGIEEYDE